MTVGTSVTGWGNYPKYKARVLTPASLSSIRSIVENERALIARGMGRSYGDSANAPTILQTSVCDRFIEFNPATGLLVAEAGITLLDILKVVVPKGWMLPVTPGTSYVTLGGAIASDVHGKNHHIAGSFSCHLHYLRMVLGTGDIITVSQSENQDLFLATCGGMGLTGVIICAAIQLIPINSSIISQTIIKANCLEEACEAFDLYQKSTYSVAWIDCLSRGKNLGRSVISIGEHAAVGGLDISSPDPISVPVYMPSALLNRFTMRAFNEIYWRKEKNLATHDVQMMPYFYPLDAVRSWNKIYGKSGFVQYQFVLPKANGVENLRKVLNKITESGEGSFLAVLKKFGEANSNLLSFPIEGYTLALDFKLKPSTIGMLRELDDIVLGMGGKVYLTKDAVMTEATFKLAYPKWEEFEEVRRSYGAIGKFGSEQSKRLGLS